MTLSGDHGRGAEGRRRARRRQPGHVVENAAVEARPRRPLVLGELVGRRREAAKLTSLAVTHRLVTVTGAPGVGKSRLARQVAADLVEPRRVYLVDLDPVTDPARVIEAVAAEVGATRHGDALAGVAACVDGAPDVVVLDNCEHVVGACADAVEQLLARCGELRIIVTSREALGVAGEAVMALAPLSLPAAEQTVPQANLGWEAVQLFCERAVAAQPSFALDATTAPAVVEICRRLDGLPLAIEMAAARLAVLALPEILHRLDDRFTLLSSPLRRGPGRAQSLRAALDVSFDLLSTPQRALLGRLSVFAGGWTAEAAEDVCAGGEVHPDAVVDLLNALVAKSLVGAEATTGRVRYQMLESTQVYAGSRLAAGGEAAALRARHARWCAELLNGTPHDEGGDAREWQADLEPEEANLSAALTWAVREGNVRLAASLVGRAVPQWWSQGRYPQAQRWLERALGLKGRIPPPLRVKLLCDAAHGAVSLADFAAAGGHANEALVLAREHADARGTTESLKLLGFMAALEGRPDRALALIDEAVTVAQSTGDASGLAHALAARARTQMFRGRTADGRLDFEASLAAARGSDPVAVVNAQVGLGWASLCLGEYDDAEAQLDNALTCARRAGDRHVTALTLAWLGELHRRRGDEDRARTHLQESAILARDVATPHPLVLAMLSLGCLADPTGEGTRAQLEEALCLARTSVPVLVAPCLVAAGEAALARGELAEAHRMLDEALAIAKRRADQAAEAEALYGLGLVARAEGEEKTAARLHHEAMQLQVDIGDRAGVADSLEALAGLSADPRSPVSAARLFGAAERLRETGGFVRATWRRLHYEADVTRVGEATTPEELAAAWAEGRCLSVKEAVAYATKGRRRRERAATGWDALTPAERQVVELVAEGLTNAEAAARLFVSAETIKGHVACVYRKLGVRSRGELRGLARPQEMSAAVQRDTAVGRP